ncbi:MAG: hypothetical protein A4E72_02114 [Syntrophus sp. PtaU1.Bin208]|nr:MAG: hypothetical protein A4E72_02114 [Syntrophus sp. PtaU1.Bin208]
MNAGRLFLLFREDGSAFPEQRHQILAADNQRSLQAACQGAQGEGEQDHQGKNQHKEEQKSGSGETKGGRQKAGQCLPQQAAGLILDIEDAQARSQKSQEPAGSQHQSGKSEVNFFPGLEVRSGKIQNGDRKQSGRQEEDAEPEEPE